MIISEERVGSIEDFDSYIISSLGENFCKDYIMLKSIESAKQFYEVTSEERLRYMDI